jgi:hypothetical protein
MLTFAPVQQGNCDQNVYFCTSKACTVRTAGGCAGVVPYLDHRQRDRLLQQRVASVFVLLYQQLRQHLCFCTSSCVSICAFVPAAASVFVLLYCFVLANLEEDVDVVGRAARVRC